MPKPEISSEDLFHLLETNKQLMTAGHRQKLLDFILDEAIRLSGAERGFVIFPLPSPGDSFGTGEREETEKTFEVAAARSFDREDLKRARVKFSKTVLRKVLETGQPLLVMDAEQEASLKEAASVMEMQLRSILAVPIRFGLESLGVLYLDNRFTEGAFQEAQVRLVKLFADQAALALHTLSALDDSRRHAEELSQLQRQLALLNEALQERADQAERERDRARALLGEGAGREAFAGIVGNSKVLRKVFQTILRLQETEATVYIHGESGTGKELVARAIHGRSRRRESSFVAVNCAAFSEPLLDSELFGHVRGAFTGAERERRGLLAEADGGTLFLDEVGEMSPGMQAKLLRVLQEKEIRPLGGNQVVKVDVRVICASNRDLAKMVKAGSFREDLFYRLNVLRLDLPPLRERPEDIPDLVHHFMQNNALGIPREFLALDEAAMHLFLNYRWPGNIRELQNEVERGLILGKGHLRADGVSAAIREGLEHPEAEAGAGLEKRLKSLEKRLVLQALEAQGGNKSLAAKTLGISRVKLYQKIRRHGLSLEHGKVNLAKVRRVLLEVKGNKTLAARRLGIGRRTLYEFLKKMG